MKIVELTGHRAALGKNEYRDAIVDILVKKGFVPIGGGAFGNVLFPPGKNYVLKLFSSNDRPYLEFIRHAKTSNNPHFPRVTGAPVRVSKLTNAVRLEPLMPLTKLGGELDDALGWFTWAATLPTPWHQSLEHMPSYRQPVAELLRKYPRLEEAMSLLRKWKAQSGLYIEWDLDSNQNIMMRDDIPVITDPWRPSLIGQ